MKLIVQLAFIALYLFISSAINAVENSIEPSFTIDPNVSEPKKFQPRVLYKTTYKGKIAYYQSSVCCDIPARLIDEKGMLICYPNGGFISVDKNCPDFIFDQSNSTRIDGLPEYMTNKRKN